MLRPVDEDIMHFGPGTWRNQIGTDLEVTSTVPDSALQAAIGDKVSTVISIDDYLNYNHDQHDKICPQVQKWRECYTATNHFLGRFKAPHHRRK